jgi:N-acetyl-1-D-myo-inositol-2-amino-2-deoxy-alpha-D-glucopyranoside deacetylase
MMRVSKRSLVRLSLLALALPCIYVGGAASAFYFHKRRAVPPSLSSLPIQASPDSQTRLIVFAPHCDDETLGCAGLIQQTLAAGGKVKVVFLTNGDGFRMAVQRNARSLNVEPSDYVAFAELRQKETLAALEHLGVKPDDIVFLGYPDRGLMNLWDTHWTPDKPYTSPQTRRSASPYPITFNSKAVYCGQNVMDDIGRILSDFQPNLVTVTHPLDDHPDHAAASAFVAQACSTIRQDQKAASWSRNLRLNYYLVHRGEWPSAERDHSAAPLVPPAEMMHKTTDWKRLALSTPQTRAKAETIALYASQTAMMNGFLSSFARANEMFSAAAAKTLPHAPANFETGNGSAGKWRNIAPICLNPLADSVVREMQGGGDLRAIYACHDAAHLYLRLDTRKSIAPRMKFTIRVRAFDTEGNSAPEALLLELTPGDVSALSDGVKAAVRGNHLEIAVPIAQLMDGNEWNAISRLAISAETALGGIEVDKTGVWFTNVSAGKKP